MKWSLAAGLVAAPMALVGAIQADLVERNYMGDSKKGYGMEMESGYGGSSTVVVEETVVVWACNGGGEKTTTMNAMASMTGQMGPAATHTVGVKFSSFPISC